MLIKAKEDKYVLLQTGEAYEITSGWQTAGEKRRLVCTIEAEEVPKKGELEIEFKGIGTVKW